MNPLSKLAVFVFLGLPAVFAVIVSMLWFSAKGYTSRFGLLVGIVMTVSTGLLGLAALGDIMVIPAMMAGMYITWMTAGLIAGNRDYALERGGVKRVNVKWLRAGRGTIIISLDGVELGKFNSAKDVKGGAQFDLPNGTVLGFTLANHPLYLFLVPKLDLNDKPLPDTPGDPALELDAAAKTFVGSGVLMVAFGAFATTLGDPILPIMIDIGLGLVAILVGIFLKRNSQIALIVGIVWIVVAILSFMPDIIAPSGGFSFIQASVDVISRVMFLVALIKSFRAITDLKREA